MVLLSTFAKLDDFSLKVSYDLGLMDIFGVKILALLVKIDNTYRRMLILLIIKIICLKYM